MDAFVERRWRSADGLSLYARDYPAGAGPARLPVICLHGLTRNAKDFADVAPWIAGQGRRVLVLDVRGRGRSDPSPDPMRYQPPVYARDVLALMDGLGIGRAVFVGTSMGGLITLLLASMRPRAVAGAVLNDVGPEIAREGLERIAAYAGKPFEAADWAAAADYLASNSGAAFPDFGPDDWRVFARQWFREDEAGRPALDYDLSIAVPLKARPPKRRSLLAWLLFIRLARGRPTLLLRGALSDLLSAKTVVGMRRAAPDMVVAEVPRVGHAPLLTEPAARQALAAFLERVP